MRRHAVNKITTNLIRHSRFSTESKATSTTSSSKMKEFKPPPSYRHQVEEGVPFGKRKFHGREGQSFTQISVGAVLGV